MSYLSPDIENSLLYIHIILNPSFQVNCHEHFHSSFHSIFILKQIANVVYVRASCDQALLLFGTNSDFFPVLFCI